MMKGKYYFKHDYNARSDPKIIRLMMSQGIAGVGAFWSIVEMLYQEGGTIPLEQIDSIAFMLHTESELISSVINDFGLFQNDGRIFWSESINRRIGKSNQISENRRKAALSRWSDANAMQMHTETMQMHENPMQVHPETMHLHSTCRNLHKTQKKANGKTPQNKGVEIAKTDAEDASALQMHENPMQMQCKTDDINNRISSSTINSTTHRESEIDCRKFMDFFNLEMDKAKAIIPRIKSISGQRKNSLHARCREYGKEALGEMVKKAAASDFLNGSNGNGWIADFSWLIRPNNFPKVIEGKYDNRQSQQNAGIGVVLTDNSEGKYNDDKIKGW